MMQNSEAKRLTDAELEVMFIIWDADEPVGPDHILEVLNETREWKRTTLSTVLSRMVKKGVIHSDRVYPRFLYTPLISEDEYKKSESKTLLQKLFKNSLPSFVSYFYSNEEIPIDELKEIHDAIDKATGKKK